jgi:TRAP-type C4-dicarboxylate transport system permease large subunit
MSTVARLKIEQIARALWPLLLAEGVVLLAVVLFPPLSTAVPAWFGYAR